MRVLNTIRAPQGSDVSARARLAAPLDNAYGLYVAMAYAHSAPLDAVTAHWTNRAPATPPLLELRPVNRAWRDRPHINE